MNVLVCAFFVLCACGSALGQASQQTQVPSPQTGATPNPVGVPQLGRDAQEKNGAGQSGNGVSHGFSPNQDLSKVPLLSQLPRPVPSPLPDNRVGVTGPPLSLSLNDAVRRALENNRDIEVARDNVRLNESNLKALEGVYDPLFQVSPQVNSTRSPTTGVLTGASSSEHVNQTDLLVNPSITKQFSSGVGEYQVFFNDLRRTTSSPFTLLSPFHASNLGITFSQPLLRDRGIDVTRRNIRIQRKRLSQSDAEFRQQTIEVIAQVQQSYWELVFALRDQENKLTTLNLAREQLRLIEARITGGIGAPLERAEAQTQIATAQTNLLSATQYVTLTENSLKQLIFPSSRAPAWSSSILPVDQPALELSSVSLADALLEARRNRPELNLLRMQQDINKIDVQFYRNQLRPRVDLQATASVSGLSGNVVNQNGALNNALVNSSASALLLGTGTVPLPSPLALTDINQVPGTNPGLLTLPNSTISPAGIGTLVTGAASGVNTAGSTSTGAGTGIGGTTGGTTGGSSGGTGGTTGGTGTGGSLTPGNGAVPGFTFTVPGTLIGGYGQQLHNLFSFSNRTVAVGVTIELPLGNRTARANFGAAKVQALQLEALFDATDQSIQADVRNAVQMVETTRQQVVSTRSARESAEVQLAGERKLYLTGLSTTFLVFQREDQLSAAVDNELRAETDYNKALSLLQRATSSTLEANNVVVQSPSGP